MFALFFVSLIALVSAQCGSSSKWVGATGQLSTKNYNVGGTVVIVDDCTVEIRQFTYTGQGPAGELYVADTFAGLTKGTELFDFPRGTAWTGMTLRETLPAGQTWDDIGPADSLTVSIWCVDFSVDFGSVTMSPPVLTGDSCEQWVGATGTLTTGAHGVAGTLTLKAGCSFLLEGFAYDGAATAIKWVAAAGTSIDVSSSDIQSPASAFELRVYDDECSAQVTSDEFLWSDAIGDASTMTVGLWCDDRVCGQVTLNKPSEPINDRLVAACDGGSQCPERNGDCLANCKLLADDYYLWWQVDGDDVTIELEAAVANSDTWMGFGVADSAAYGMVGADVTIAGFVGGDGQALDYYLQSKSQCDYSETQSVGVCPDDNMDKCDGLAAGATGANNVEFISGSDSSGVQRIRFKRPLTSADPCDRSFEADSRVVWGTGPITQGGPQLVVNIHQRRSPFPGDGDDTTRFDARSTPGIGAACITAPSNGNDDEEEEVACVAKQLIKGETVFDMSIAHYEQHPSPPGWGLSWHVNENEFAEILVERGTEYTFLVDASEQHPFYITDDAVGGRSVESETVFAGSANAFASAGEKFTVKWTPDENTPDTVFYQCWTHQKLGWRIYVVDEGESDSFEPPQDTATVCSSADGEGEFKDSAVSNVAFSTILLVGATLMLKY